MYPMGDAAVSFADMCGDDRPSSLPDLQGQTPSTLRRPAGDMVPRTSWNPRRRAQPRDSSWAVFVLPGLIWSACKTTIDIFSTGQTISLRRSPSSAIARS